MAVSQGLNQLALHLWDLQDKIDARIGDTVVILATSITTDFSQYPLESIVRMHERDIAESSALRYERYMLWKEID